MKYYLKENFRFLYADGQLYDENDNVVYYYENKTLLYPKIGLYKDDKMIGFVKKNFTWFLRQYDLFLDDEFVGSLDQKFTWFRSQLDLSDLGWTIRGDLFDWHYEIYDKDDLLIARVDQELFRLTQRFYIDIYDEDNEELVILLVIALNQFDKDRAAASSAASSGSHSSH
ncbi:MAG: hypothetical protein IJL85_03115 [Erysipelotrichaceae bacterium]|nr:hypothetical protein [Erysipelotrichaceae bacterium]